MDGSLLSGLSLGLHVFILFTILAPFYDISLCHFGINVKKCFFREIRGSLKLAWQKCLPGGGGRDHLAVNKSTSIMWKEGRQNRKEALNHKEGMGWELGRQNVKISVGSFIKDNFLKCENALQIET